LEKPSGRTLKECKALAPIPCGFHAEILAFLDCLRTGRTPTPSLTESLQVLEAISKSRPYRLR